MRAVLCKSFLEWRKEGHNLLALIDNFAKLYSHLSDVVISQCCVNLPRTGSGQLISVLCPALVLMAVVTYRLTISHHQEPGDK